MKGPNWWPAPREDADGDKVDLVANWVVGIVVGTVLGYFLVSWIMIG